MTMPPESDLPPELTELAEQSAELADSLTEVARSLGRRTRSGWDEKSLSYRKRLEGAGRSGKLGGTPMSAQEVRRYWERGGDLRGGRGHRPKRTWTPAPRDATERESTGLGDAQTYADLQKWRRRPPSRGGPPRWIPKSEQDLGTDVAAILSQLDIPPSEWAKVEFHFLPSGGAIMIVRPRRGYARAVLLPDSHAVSEVGRLIRSPESTASSAAERKRLHQEWARRKGDGIEVTTYGYRHRRDAA